jgi:ribosomal protein S12
MADNNIQLNPSKPTELEFDVMIQGIGKMDVPVVRFVIVSAIEDYDFSFRCIKVEGEKSKWVAMMPALPGIKSESADFRVEVIIDDYYFEPAAGEITFISTPEVHFKDKKGTKPTVSTSFTVKQKDVVPSEEKPAKKKNVKEDVKPVDAVTEAAGGGEITGQYAPSNDLLVPEEDPASNGRMRGNKPVNDEFTDEDRLSLDKAEEISSSITPGEGRAYQQEDGKKQDEPFDAKKVASGIVKTTMGGGAKKPDSVGSLFKRDSSGKAVIRGLESESSKKQLKDNADKVKDILGN